MTIKVKSYILSSVFAAIFVFTGCKKDAGPDGKKTVSGIVTYSNGVTGTNDVAAGAQVHIAYGTTAQTIMYDQTVLTDINGKYSFQGLRKGDYFITSEFTDIHGFIYSTPGYGLTIKDRNTDFFIDILLK